MDTAFALAGVTDPGTGGHTATVTWGDGGSGVATIGEGTGGTPPGAHGTHAYTAAGSFTVTVRVCDSSPPAPADTCAEASFTVTVVATPRPNTAPIASALAVTTDVGASVVITPAGTDADGDPLSFRPAGPATHGAVLAQPDGTFHYVPDAGFAGLDTFSYVADDGQAVSAPALVTVQVGAIMPVAVDDVLRIPAGVTTEVAVTTLLANDHDPRGRSIAFAGAFADVGTHVAIDDGTVPGVLRLTPSTGFAGATTFTYGIAAGPAPSPRRRCASRSCRPRPPARPGAPTGVSVTARLRRPVALVCTGLGRRLGDHRVHRDGVSRREGLHHHGCPELHDHGPR